MNPGPNPSADHRDRTPAGQAGGRGVAPGREVLVGLVERVTFYNPETGFCVLRIKARGHRDLVTAVGHAAMISAGEWITASGEWTNDRTHGLQFRVRFLKASTLSVSNSLSGRHWELDHVPAVGETQRTLFSSARATMCACCAR